MFKFLYWGLACIPALKFLPALQSSRYQSNLHSFPFWVPYYSRKWWWLTTDILWGVLSSTWCAQNLSSIQHKNSLFLSRNRVNWDYLYERIYLKLPRQSFVWIPIFLYLEFYIFLISSHTDLQSNSSEGTSSVTPAWTLSAFLCKFNKIK